MIFGIIIDLSGLSLIYRDYRIMSGLWWLSFADYGLPFQPLGPLFWWCRVAFLSFSETQLLIHSICFLKIWRTPETMECLQEFELTSGNLSNIAVENGSLVDEFPIQTSILMGDFPVISRKTCESNCERCHLGPPTTKMARFRKGR